MGENRKTFTTGAPVEDDEDDCATLITNNLIDIEIEAPKPIPRLTKPPATINGNSRVRGIAENQFLAEAKTRYTDLIKEINEGGYDVTQFNEKSQAAKDAVTSSFTKECTENTGFNPAGDLLRDLETFMNEVPTFKIVNRDILEISGPSLKSSTALLTSEIILTSRARSVKEVHWISPGDVTLDKDISGDLWSGKNLVICAQRVLIDDYEVAINVSGKTGKSARFEAPSPPRKLGLPGDNGEDGQPGENGGNVAIVTRSIDNPQNLKIISNGGTGGNGQPGGAGLYGKDGVDGDTRLKITMEDILTRFPSPASVDKKSTEKKKNLDAGHQYLRELSKGVCPIKQNPGCNTNSQSLALETIEGAKIEYGYFEDGGGASLYVWVQGAPGTNGQPGGKGGWGGRGGSAGSPGDVFVPKDYTAAISIIRSVGKRGTDGGRGPDGDSSKAADGKQGTDFAFVDPYPSFWSKTRPPQKSISGNLQVSHSNSNDGGNMAYCPHNKKYINFTASTTERGKLKVYGEPEEPDMQGEAPVATRQKEIDIYELYFKLGTLVRN